MGCYELTVCVVDLDKATYLAGTSPTKLNVSPHSGHTGRDPGRKHIGRKRTRLWRPDWAPSSFPNPFLAPETLAEAILALCDGDDSEDMQVSPFQPMLVKDHYINVLIDAIGPTAPTGPPTARAHAEMLDGAEQPHDLRRAPDVLRLYTVGGGPAPRLRRNRHPSDDLHGPRDVGDGPDICHRIANTTDSPSSTAPVVVPHIKRHLVYPPALPDKSPCNSFKTGSRPSRRC
ncbi:hypothetical protein DFH07DRAFT_352172 [Mycena maculata]|uniref:Uncharacterized protein n=1 Tax=Mycena maculata TaxID=230809 RepID=A0AAD7JJU4_9AGAR|nr:hypothetical protein DFH07DRAFT_352172 [Mycena maculata]